MARFKPITRKFKEQLDEVPIVEGQFLVATDPEEIYVDNGPITRKRIAGKSTVVTENSATIELSGDGSAASPLKAELIQGAGTANEPFLIYTVDGLIRLRDEVNSGDSKIEKYYKLMNDLDLQGGESNQWTPIGGVDYKPFCGTFDGNGHKIKNVYINNPNRSYAGLFGLLQHGTIQRLGVENAYIVAASSVGGLVGTINNSACVINCYSTGHISGNSTIGGLVGYSQHSQIINCYSHASTEINEANGGGLIGGATSSLISQSYSTGSVICASGIFVGGLLGQISGSEGYPYTIEKCYFDTQTSGLSAGIGLAPSQNGVEGKTTAEMQFIATYVGWDFNNIWKMPPVTGYPIFQFINESENQSGCSCSPYGFQKTGKAEIAGGIATIDLSKEDVSIFIVNVTANLSIVIPIVAIPENNFRTFEIHIIMPSGGGLRPPVVTLPFANWVDGSAPTLEAGKTNVIAMRTDGGLIDNGSEMVVNYVANLAYTY